MGWAGGQEAVEAGEAGAVAEAELVKTANDAIYQLDAP